MANLVWRSRKDGSGTFWTRYRHGGREYRKDTGTDNRQRAEKVLRQQLNALDAGAAPEVDPRKVTYTEIRNNLVSHYQQTGERGEREYMKRIVRLDSFFGAHRAGNITPAEVRRYVEHRRAHLIKHADGSTTPTSNATINREVAVLTKMLGRAYQERLLVHVPKFAKLEESAARTGFTEREEFTRLRKHLPDDVAAIATIAYTYGCRLGEILGLGWRHAETADERRDLTGVVDFDAREVRLLVGMTKNGEGRQLPFTPEVETLLTAQYARVPKGNLWAFPLVADGRTDHRLVGTRRQSIDRSWATATRAIGRSRLLFHDLRRTAVRNLVRAGVSENVAMTISGHRSATVFARYNVSTSADRQAAMRKLVESELSA